MNAEFPLTVKGLLLAAAMFLYGCGAGGGFSASVYNGVMPVAPVVITAGYVFLKNDKPYDVEVAYLDSFTAVGPSLELTTVAAGERLDILIVELPADEEVEFDLAFQVPGEQAFRIRRTAT